MPTANGDRVVAEPAATGRAGAIQDGRASAVAVAAARAVAAMAEGRARCARARDRHRRHRQRVRLLAGEGTQAPGGVASGEPELCGVARWAAGRRLCAGGGAGDQGRSGICGSRRRCRRLVRRGGALRLLSGQPFGVRRAGGERRRQAAWTARPASPCAMRWRRRASRAGRAWWSIRRRYVGYLEAHIEQGDWLEANKLKIGVVTSIVGIRQFRIVFEGVQNHAGTTRMAIRKDAGLALAHLAVAIDEALSRRLRASGRCGRRGASRSIPARPASSPAARRCCSRSAMPTRRCSIGWSRRCASMVAEADAKGPCRVKVELIRKSIPAVMAPPFQAAIEAAAEAHAPGKHSACRAVPGTMRKCSPTTCRRP